MAQTILYPVKNFDATLPTVLKFEYFGGIISKNKLVIRDNLTNTIVYSKEQASMRAEHKLLPENSNLKNGQMYNAQICVSSEGESTYDSLSNEIVFQCFSTPTIEFEGFPKNTIVNNSSVFLSLKYIQDQNDLLNSYNVTLYNAGNEEIWNSGTKYPGAKTTPYAFSQIIQNLENNRQYYVRCTVESVNGMVAATEKVIFTVNYVIPEQFSIISAENIPEMCSIKVATSVVMIDGRGSSDDMKYINNNEIDLTSSNDYVIYDSNFSISGDFLLKTKFRNLEAYTTLVTLADEVNHITVKLMKGLLFGESKIRFYFVLRASNGFTDYITTSNLIDNITSDDAYVLIIQRRNSLFKIDALKANGGD